MFVTKAAQLIRQIGSDRDLQVFVSEHTLYDGDDVQAWAQGVLTGLSCTATRHCRCRPTDGWSPKS